MQSNREVVVRYLEAMHVGDLNVVADCVSEDVTRYGPRPTSKYAPPVHGREAFLAAYHGPEYFQMGTLSMEIEHMVAEGGFVGGFVAVQFILRARTRQGAPYENYYHFLFECAGGKVKTIWEYIDTLYAQQAFA
jgi:ketosteroid isomerase-like protein